MTTNGGENAIVSASGRARVITPRSRQRRAIRGPTRRERSNGRAGEREATNSTAPINPIPRDLADERVVVERLVEALVEPRAARGRLGDEPVPLDDVEVLHRRGRRDGVGGVCVAVPEDALRRIRDDAPHPFRDEAARERDVRGRQALRDRDQVRLDPEELAPEPAAEASEAGDHLVGDQQDVVATEHLLDRREVTRGRDEHTAGCLQRLGDKGGDGLRALPEDQLLEVVREEPHEVVVRHPLGRLPEPVRRPHVPDHRERKVEPLVKVGQAGQSGGEHRDAVVPAGPRDELLLLGTVECVVVEPDELRVGVVRVRAARPEEHLGHGDRGGGEDALGEEGGRLGRHRREAVVVGEPLDLARDRLGHLRPAVPDVHAPETGHRVEVRLTAGVPQRATAAAYDHVPAVLLVAPRLAERVEDVLPVDVLDRVGGLRRHGAGALSASRTFGRLTNIAAHEGAVQAAARREPARGRRRRRRTRRSPRRTRGDSLPTRRTCARRRSGAPSAGRPSAGRDA